MNKTVTDYHILCPKCHNPMRHRALSGLWWCPNTECSDYKGIPPIKVNRQPNMDLIEALSDKGWKAYEAELRTKGGE